MHPSIHVDLPVGFFFTHNQVYCEAKSAKYEMDVAALGAPGRIIFF
jgi:hypothetical protein